MPQHEKVRAVFRSCIAIALVASVYARASGATPPVGYRITDNLYGVSFVSEQDGWLVGAYGSIFRTEDGGYTWQLQKSPTEQPLFAVDFVDRRNGWVVGRSGVILHTSDAGEAWTAQKSETEHHLFSVDFADAEVGCAVGDWGVILSTSDGGTSWVPKPLKRDVILNGVFMADREHGWIVGERGTILKTEDGGGTWSEQQSGIEKTLFGTHFLNRQHGWAVGIDGIILRTEDGGQSWQVQKGLTEIGALEQVGVAQAFDHPSLYAITVAGEYGFAVGEIGAIFHSEDRGRTWVRLTAPQDWAVSWLRDVSVVSGTHGVIVGAGGRRIMVVDGQIAWPRGETHAAEAVH